MTIKENIGNFFDSLTFTDIIGIILLQIVYDAFIM